MKPILVLRRGEQVTDRLADWIRRNQVTSARVYYVGDATTDPEVLQFITEAWRITALTPNLFIDNTWVRNEQAIKDALWKAQQGPSITAYLQHGCGACGRVKRMIESSRKLQALIRVKYINDDKRALLEMHDNRMLATPAMLEQTPQGPKTYGPNQMMLRLIEMS